MYVWEAIRNIAADVARATAAAPAAPAVTVGKVVLTGGDVRALGAVAWRLVQGAASTEDAEIVADTIIEAALTGAGGPIAALAAPAAEALAGLIIAGIAAGTIRPGESKEGWTHETAHAGRRA